MGLWSWKKNREVKRGKYMEKNFFVEEKKSGEGKGRKEKEYTFFGGGGKRGKYFVNENLWFVEEKRTEREMEENIWRRKIYGLQKRRKMEKK